ncbi:MAG: hypothetical protein WCO98_08860 [bacterium]
MEKRVEMRDCAANCVPLNRLQSETEGLRDRIDEMKEMIGELFNKIDRLTWLIITTTGGMLVTIITNIIIKG